MTPSDIKQARQTLGLTQEQMASALNLTHYKTYGKWETGEREPNTVAVTAIEMLLYMQQVGALEGWMERQG